MAETTAKEAKRVITLEDIKFSEKSKVPAMLSCIPLVGLIMLFVEKEDLFVRYHAAQFGSAMILFVLSFIPIVNCVAFIINLVVIVLMVLGMVNIYKGKRFDAPVLSTVGLKILNSMQ